MRVVHLSKYYHPYSGGVESVVKDLATSKSIDSIVLAADRDNLPKSECIEGVDVIRSKELFNLFSTSFAPGYIFDFFNNIRNDVIHIHLPNPLANVAFLTAIPFILPSTKVVVHWHSDIVKQKRLLKIYQPLVKLLLARADVIIPTSQRYLESSIQLSNFKDKCKVIPIGIKSLKERVDNDLVLSIKKSHPGKKIIFSLGRHIYYKGFEYLIEAAKSIDDAVFLIGGTGPDTKKYLTLIKKFNLQDKVKLIGRVSDSDLPSYYASSHIFCFPSVEKSEAFGVVQLEAMSLGIPVVCTNIEGSGVPWVNKHMSSGLVCEPKNAKALADSLNTIMFNKELHHKLSEGALERYKNLFSRDVMNNNILNLYSDL